ncbi:MAG: DUF4358 domain-containing protein [Lachnospiraceae bacterium]
MKKIIAFVLIATIGMSLCACGNSGKNVNQEVELDTVVEAIKTAYGENYVPSMQVEDDMIAEVYGITDDMYEDIFIEVPMISAQIDTLVAVKCKEGQQQAVVDALNAYRNYLVHDSMQYPMNMTKLQASRVIEKQGFVFFVALGVIPMEVEEQGEGAVVQAATEQNDIAEKAISEYLQ